MRIFIFEDEFFSDLLEKEAAGRGREFFSFSTPATCPHHTSPVCQCDEDHVCADVIIVDVDMPRISGLDFVGQQKTRGCRCPNFAVISGKWSTDDRELAVDLGCRVFDKNTDADLIGQWLDTIERNIDPRRKLCDRFQAQLSESITFKKRS